MLSSKDKFSKEHNKKLDSIFLDDYWANIKNLVLNQDDNSILNLRNAIYETYLKRKLIFIGNGASASLASHAATDFTKQAKIPLLLLMIIIS